MTRQRPTAETVGAVLRTLREARGLSQEQLASQAGLHRTFIGLIERAERNVTWYSIERVLSALDVSWAEFGTALDQRAREHARR